MSKSLPFVTANTTIKTFRHALSLDEVGLGFAVSCRENKSLKLLACTAPRQIPA